MVYSLVVLAVCACMGLTLGQSCTRPSSRPSISWTPKIYDHFEVEVEQFKTVDNVKILTPYKLFYDNSVFSTIRYIKRINGYKVDMLMDFNQNKIMTYNYKNHGYGICGTADLDKSLATNLFGGLTITSGVVPTGLELLKFNGTDGAGDEIYPEYKGSNHVIRGKPAHQFISCQTWMLPSGKKIVATVTHYFLDTSSWTFPMQGDGFSIPLEMRIVGTNGKLSIDERYSYFNLRTSEMSGDMLPPQGIYCKSFTSTKPFPTPAPLFKWSYEVIDRQMQTHLFMDEIYDSVLVYDVTRMAYGGKKSTFTELGTVSVINDYPTGISYKLDATKRSCDIALITSRNSVDAFDVNDNIAEQHKPSRVLYATDPKHIVYTGQRMVRRTIIADTWVGIGNFKDLGKVVIEWFFAAEDTTSWNDASKAKYRIPLKMRIWKPPMSKLDMLLFNRPVIPPGEATIDINIFRVDYMKVMFNTISLKMCLTKSPSSFFQITFKDSQSYFQTNLESDFKWQTLLYISRVTTVHWLRIADLKFIYKSNRDSVLQFEILDAPTLPGSDQPLKKQTSLADATNLLKSQVKSGQFVLTGNPIEGKPTKVYADKYSLVQGTVSYSDSASDSGYSGGSLAGLGVSMLIIGGIAGGGMSFYAMFRR